MAIPPLNLNLSSSLKSQSKCCCVTGNKIGGKKKGKGNSYVVYKEKNNVFEVAKGSNYTFNCCSNANKSERNQKTWEAVQKGLSEQGLSFTQAVQEIGLDISPKRMKKKHLTLDAFQAMQNWAQQQQIKAMQEQEMMEEQKNQSDSNMLIQFGKSFTFNSKEDQKPIEGSFFIRRNNQLEPLTVEEIKKIIHYSEKNLEERCVHKIAKKVLEELQNQHPQTEFSEEIIQGIVAQKKTSIEKDFT